MHSKLNHRQEFIKVVATSDGLVQEWFLVSDHVLKQ